MSDTDQVIEGLGFFGESPEVVEDQSAAAESATTSQTGASPHETSDDETESISVSEALAELDGEAAPETADDPAEPIADAAENPDNLPPHVLEAMRELDALKAEKAEVEAHQAEAQFLAPWQNQQAVNDDYFEAEVERIQALGQQEGRSQAEIDAAIYNRVEKGNGFGIQRINPQTRQPELIGRIQADAELQENLRRAAVNYERSKTAPDAFEQLVTKYQLPADDRLALAKYRNLPPEYMESLAQDYAAKNQRLHSTQAQVRNEAVANVRANLSRQPVPGLPGAAPKVRQLKAPTTAAESRQMTELVSRRLGFLGSTG